MHPPPRQSRRILSALALLCLARQARDRPLGTFEDFLAVLRLGTAQRADHTVHFLVGDERAVHADGHRGARLQEQHVAVTEQLLRSALVENRA